MKKWNIILAATLVATWLVVDIVHEFFADETLRFFSSQPVRLLYLGIVAIAGGVTAFGFSGLSPSQQRRVKVFALGAAASTWTAIIGYFAFRLTSLSSFVIKSGGAGWALVGLLIFSSIATYRRDEFYLTWKTGTSQ